MAVFHSGVGGKAEIGATVINITDWQFTKTARLAEVTHSGSGGIAEWKKVLVEAAGSFNFPWDSDQIPDTDVTLDAGDTLTLELFCGDSGKKYEFAAIVESLSITNNSQNDVVRATVNFKSNGAITDPVT